MSELTEQVVDSDLIKDSLLASTINRTAHGEVEFEGTTFYVGLELYYERNGKYEGEYYVVKSHVRERGNSDGRIGTEVTEERESAEERFEELLEKYDLQESEDVDGETIEKERDTLLEKLRKRLSESSVSGEVGEDVNEAETPDEDPRSGIDVPPTANNPDREGVDYHPDDARISETSDEDPRSDDGETSA